MIYLHKLLPLLLSPIVAVCFLFAYGTIRRNGIVALSGILLLYLASTPLVAERLFRYAENNEVKQNPKALPKANAIVVLSGMLVNVQSSQGTIQEWGDPDRFFGGIELYKLGKSGKLIFTGGILPWSKEGTPEGVTLKNYAKSMNVPESDIIVTGEVENTEQEASAVKKLFKKDKPSILLVTSAYHMPRARLLFESKGFVVHPYAVDFKVGVARITPMDFLPDVNALRLTDIAIREQLGLLYYRIKAISNQAA